MDQDHAAEQLSHDAQQGSTGQIARRGLLVKGAAAAAGITAGVFVPPRITSLNLHASPAAAASGPLPE